MGTLILMGSDIRMTTKANCSWPLDLLKAPRGRYFACFSCIFFCIGIQPNMNVTQTNRCSIIPSWPIIPAYAGLLCWALQLWQGMYISMFISHSTLLVLFRIWNEHGDIHLCITTIIISILSLPHPHPPSSSSPWWPSSFACSPSFPTIIPDV